MKKLAVIPVIAAFVIFLISYTTMENSIADAPIVKETADKKQTTTKSKTKKKKPVKKIKTLTAARSQDASPEKESKNTETTGKTAPENSTIMNIVTNKVNAYALQNDMSTEYCFLVDMSLPSGRNRFFIYDLNKKSILYAGLVAHGSCNERFLSRPRFSNDPKTGCSSLGKYKVGEFYTGKYGKSYRLHGLDNCNSNAFRRAVVIHGYNCVPDREIYPQVLCNSLGCVMVSYNFFDKISRIIRKTDKPIILWVYQ